VLVVRDDEAHHRDVNHGFASTLGGRPRELTPVAAYPTHATELNVGA
jgi:ubiquinol oxidase